MSRRGFSLAACAAVLGLALQAGFAAPLLAQVGSPGARAPASQTSPGAVAQAPAPPRSPPPSSGKELIAILDFEIVGASKAEASIVSDRLREELLHTGRFTIVDRSQVDAILSEQAFQQSGCTSQECAVQVGKILGVRRIVSGKVTKASDTLWQASVQMVDVETAETLRAESLLHEGRYVDLVRTGIPELAVKIAGSAPIAAAPVAAPPPTGRVSIVSQPAGAEIVLDGKPIPEKSDVVLERLTPGQHSVALAKGELLGSATFTAVAGETVKVEVTLAQNAIAVRIESAPAEAAFFLDGKEQGNTPLELQLIPASYRFEVRQPGYISAEGKFEVKSGGETRLTATLEPMTEDYARWSAEHSRWNGGRWSGWIAGGALLAYGAVEARAVTASKAKQDDLAASARSATTSQAYSSALAQLKREESSARDAKKLSDAAYVLGALGVGVAWWLQRHEPPRPPTEESTYQFTVLPQPEAWSVALSWRY